MCIYYLLRGLYLCVILSSCHSINQELGLADDNLGEEIAEEVVEDAIFYQFGFKPDLDFTP